MIKKYVHVAREPVISVGYVGIATTSGQTLISERFYSPCGKLNLKEWILQGEREKQERPGTKDVGTGARQTVLCLEGTLKHLPKDAKRMLNKRNFWELLTEDERIFLKAFNNQFDIEFMYAGQI